MRSVAAAFLLAALAGAAQGDELRCKAIDGDTISCGNERVRLIGICAAEIGEQGGFVAREKLERLVEAHQVVIERHGEDRYGRTLAHVLVDGRRIAQQDIGPAAGRGLRYCTK